MKYKYLTSEQLPKFQERLDLAASELNNMEEIFLKAINELYGRCYIIGNNIPKEDRDKYAEETNYPVLDKMIEMFERMDRLELMMNQLIEETHSSIAKIELGSLDLEARLNALDDAAARKDDLNTVLYRTGKE